MTGPLADILVPPSPGLGPERRAGAWEEARVRTAAAAIPAEPRSRDLLLGVALLWHDHLDAAHAICQAREGDPEADWLHAILHRREPDPGNSRYWYARVGAHPGFAGLATAAAGLGLGDELAPGGSWRPEAMIAACGRPGPRRNALEALQATELGILAAAAAG